MSAYPAACLVVEYRKGGGELVWQPAPHHPLYQTTLWLFPSDTLKFGSQAQNHMVIPEPTLSRNHFEIYCVAVHQNHRPLVFVRDRQSITGTYVNERLVGKGPSLSPGWLLKNGDIITVGPYISVKFSEMPMKIAPQFGLKSHQLQEALSFKDKFVIHNRAIGHGAYGIIYLATEVKTGKQVVCKVHDLASLSRSPDTLDRIRGEAFVLNDLSHPNILSFKGAFQRENTMFTFTELATGGDLFSLQVKRKTFKEIEIRWIVRQVLTAVAYCHSKRVAHRDIKRENILCAIAPDASHRVLLSDFGVAAWVNQGMSMSMVGTRGYLAPECYIPENGHGLSVDIWAIGILTLHLFAGENKLIIPSHDVMDPEKFDAFLQDTLDRFFPPADDGTAEGLSDDARRFLDDCFTYDKDSRPTADDMLKSPWLQEPVEDNAYFNGLQTENVSPWVSREPIHPAIDEVGLGNGENAAESGEEKTRGFESVPLDARLPAMMEAKLGSKKRLDPLDLFHAGRGKRQRLYSM